MKYIDELIERYPVLKPIKEEIVAGYDMIKDCYQTGGKLLIVGNGGSASDAEHIAGELMKRFRIPRPVEKDFVEKLKQIDVKRGEELAKKLERTLLAIPLGTHLAMTTAYINDVGAKWVYAQQVLGFGHKGDVLLAISTSGNSANVMEATVVARAIGIKVLGLTGRDGGELARVSDMAVVVPETETYLIQEMHLPIYHCWCMMLEEYFFM